MNVPEKSKRWIRTVVHRESIKNCNFVNLKLRKVRIRIHIQRLRSTSGLSRLVAFFHCFLRSNSGLSRLLAVLHCFLRSTSGLSRLVAFFHCVLRSNSGLSRLVAVRSLGHHKSHKFEIPSCRALIWYITCYGLKILENSFFSVEIRSNSAKFGYFFNHQIRLVISDNNCIRNLGYSSWYPL